MGRPASKWIVTVLTVVGVAAGVVGLVAGAVHGSTVLAADNNAANTAQARINDAVYDCLAVQAHSLVRPDEPVTVPSRGIATFFTLVDLLQATEGSLTIVLDPRRPVPELTITTAGGPGTCHGMVVELRSPRARGGAVLRRGTGASVPGSGPLPNPEL